MADRDSVRARGVRQVARALALVWIAGCGAAPVPPGEVEAAEEAALAPFAAKQDVLCNRLEIVLTANFYRDIVRTTIAAVHAEEHEAFADGGAVYRYTNRAPEGDPPMRFRIGGVEFGALREATVHVLGGRNALTVGAVASGGVVVSRDGGQGGEEVVKEYRLGNAAAVPR